MFALSQRIWVNVGAIALAAGLATLGILNGGAHDGPQGMALLITMWIPSVLGLLGIGLYFLLYWIARRWAVLATGFTVVLLLVIGWQSYTA